MSATLTWYNSGLGTKNGTTVAFCITDLVALFATKAADANFSWVVASSSTAGNPNYIVLKRKDASAGRILLTIYTGAPAGVNAAIFEGSPTTNVLLGMWFPAGNVDSPSNLLSASGTIMGDDTNCVKAWPNMAISTIYSTSVQAFYLDCAEGVLFGFQNPGTTQPFLAGAGNLVVDAADNTYGCVLSSAVTGFSTSTSNANMSWSTSATTAGTAAIAALRTNYGSANRVYFSAWLPSAPAWITTTSGSTDILTNTATNAAYFVPIQLLGLTKGEGFVLKLRQIAIGPATTAAFTQYSTTGPVVKAINVCASTTGSPSAPWVTNFKL